jgi:plasmid stability protein
MAPDFSFPSGPSETRRHGEKLLPRLVNRQRVSAARLPLTLTYDGMFITMLSTLSFFGVAIMAAVTIRNLSEEVHRALKVRAAQHNRSAEAEMRAILEAAVRPEGRLRLGTAIAEISRKIGLTNADVAALEQARDTNPAQPLRFE